MAMADTASPEEGFTLEQARIKVGLFPVKDMFIDPNYQRTGKQGRVHQMAEDWKPELAGVMELSARVDDQNSDVIRYAVIDGGTRLTAAREATARKLQQIDFLYGRATWGLTPQQEARLFAAINFQRTAVHVVERFKADNYAGTEPARSINQALVKHGLRVDYTATEQTVAAVKSLEQAYLWGALPFVLRVITEAWMAHADARGREPILALAAFDKCYREDGYSEADLIEALRSNYPASLLDQARHNVKAGSTTIRSAWAEMARLIANVYNRGRKTKAEGRLGEFKRPDLPRAAQTITKNSRSESWRDRQARQRRRSPEQVAADNANRTLERARQVLGQ